MPLIRAISILLITVLLAAAGTAGAQQPISASPDVTIDLGSGVVPADQDVAVDNQLGMAMLEGLGVLQGRDAVNAFGLDVNGDRLIAFETTTQLPGGGVARPGDVVRYDGSTYSIEFDAAAAGIPAGVATDATSLSPGGLLLSFDTTVSLGGGLVAADEDLVVWNGSSFALLFDGSAEGVDSSLDVDAAQDLGGGAYAMSFDASGVVGGIAFDDEDVLRFDGSGWSLELDASALHASWAAADLDAVMVPEPGVVPMLGAGVAVLAGLARRRGAARPA